MDIQELVRVANMIPSLIEEVKLLKAKVSELESIVDEDEDIGIKEAMRLLGIRSVNTMNKRIEAGLIKIANPTGGHRKFSKKHILSLQVKKYARIE